ncbi:MAG: F0F1 ATP synthase subunit A [bacterium]|nr:F0F1 ATP synthase subunit A [bacterium]
MTEKPSHKSPLKLILIIVVALVGMSAVSFIGGGVGKIIFGGGAQPTGIFAIHAPKPELPAERPFCPPGEEGAAAGKCKYSFFTNTMITAWISIAFLLFLFITATRKIRLIPKGLQNFVEFFIESAQNFIDDTAGKEYGRKFFPVCVTLFLFVLLNAWFSLVPGFETIKLNHMPLLRNANTDINTPMMLAVVSFCFVEYWGFRANGFHYLKKFVNFSPALNGIKQVFSGQVKAGLGAFGMGLITLFTCFLETISELVRLMSFTFRLFGNMTAGMITTLVIMYIVPWVVPSIFYGLETFLGFVQALIFGGLTLCFLALAVTPHEEESH